MIMDEKKMKEYEAPSTKKTLVELEDDVCGTTGSNVSIKKTDNGNNVEVDEYISVENDITFE